jgi:paraquat-inducible protein B
MQSFVTGLLFVALDFFPDTPIKLMGLDPAYPEVPTIPSDMDQIKSNIQQAMAEFRKLPLETILNEVLAVLTRAKVFLDAPELKQTLVALHDVMTDARQLLHSADGQLGALGPKLGGTADVAAKALETLRVTLLDAQKLVRDVDVQVAPLAGSAKETLASAKEALTAARSALGQAQKSLGTLTDAATPVLKQADKTLAGTTALTGPDSAVLNDLSRTLRALDEAARSIRTLAGALERNPEMLIRGRSK